MLSRIFFPGSTDGKGGKPLQKPNLQATVSIHRQGPTFKSNMRECVCVCRLASGISQNVSQSEQTTP